MIEPKARTELLEAMQRSLPGVKRAVEAPPKTLWNTYEQGWAACMAAHERWSEIWYMRGFASAIGMVVIAAVVWRLVR